ncbi:RNA polymerase sigma factor [Patescibacteria group bacterium]
MDPKNLSDEELVKRVQSDDQELYRNIIERYEKKLRRYAMTFVRDADIADDVLQNSFIKAFINLRGFNTKKKFSSWIYRIVHNEALNEIKKHKKELRLEDVVEYKDILSKDIDIAEEVDKNKAKEMLDECLVKLPITYREPLVLFYLEERSYNEISDILRMPIGTVGTRIKRGLVILNKIFTKMPSKNV